MKRISILVMAIMVTCGAFAQPSKKMQHENIIRTLLQPQGRSNMAMKTTAGVPLERVKAQSTRNNTTSSLNDSVYLRYGINRYSVYDYNTMIYPYYYPYNITPMFNYAGTFTQPQVLYDSMWHWTVNPNTLIYGYYETGAALYDAYRNMTNYMEMHADSATLYRNLVSANTFTAANNIASGLTSNWVAGVADSAFKQYYSYNTANKLVKDSTYEEHLGTWRLVSKTFYTYDISNNLVSISSWSNTYDTSFTLPLIEQLRYTNTYDGSNRLLTVQADCYDGTSLVPYMRDTFGYSGAMTYHNAWRQHQWDAINSYWAPMFNMTKVISGTTGLPDTIFIKSYDSLLNSWVPQTMNVMTYNVSNNPTMLKDYEYNFTSYPSTPNFTTRYYYETYTNTLGVNDMPMPEDVRVFPNPASDVFTVKGMERKSGDLVTLTLVSVGGQVMRREGMVWNGETKVAVRGFAPGIYCLMIQDAAGSVMHRQVITVGQ